MSLSHADLVLAEHANSFAVRHDGLEDVARTYAGIAELLFIAGVALLLLAGVVLRRDRLAVASVLSVLAAGIGVVAAAVLSQLVDRPRPFVAHPEIHAFLAHAPDPGFPSDHATAAFAIGAVFVLRLGVRAVPVLLAAAALALSRVVVGVHYPGDVIAGALIGVAAAVAICVLASRPGVTAAARRARPTARALRHRATR